MVSQLNLSGHSEVVTSHWAEFVSVKRTGPLPLLVDRS